MAGNVGYDLSAAVASSRAVAKALELSMDALREILTGEPPQSDLERDINLVVYVWPAKYGEPFGL